jgi:hypothetical protein
MPPSGLEYYFFMTIMDFHKEIEGIYECIFWEL